MADQPGFDSASDLVQDAAAVGRDRSTLQISFDAHHEDHVESLLKDDPAGNFGRPETLNPDVRQAVEVGGKEGLRRTVPQMRADRREAFGIALQLGTLDSCLESAGARCVCRVRETLSKIQHKPPSSVRNCASGSRPRTRHP